MTLYTISPLSMLIIVLTFVSQRKHMLMALLCLECMILVLTFIMMLNLPDSANNNTQMFIILLTLGACEASLGLALLVTMTRQFGSDMMNLLSLNKC